MDITYTEEDHDRDTFSAVNENIRTVSEEANIEKIVRRVLKTKFS